MFVFFASKMIIFVIICDALRALLPFVQFKQHGKHQCRILTFTLLHGCFSRFLNSLSGTKSHKVSLIVRWSHIVNCNIQNFIQLILIPEFVIPKRIWEGSIDWFTNFLLKISARSDLQMKTNKRSIILLWNPSSPFIYSICPIKYPMSSAKLLRLCLQEDPSILLRFFSEWVLNSSKG